MTNTQTKERPAVAAIAKIMAEVGAVKERGRNAFHGYNYATAADIAHALQKRMAEHGLVIIPYAVQREIIGRGDVLCIDFAFRVIHVSGDEFDEWSGISVPRPTFPGMASCVNKKGGFDDKAANKCLTAAVKYFTLALFKIPTGEYQDADADGDKPAPAAPMAVHADDDTGELISDEDSFDLDNLLSDLGEDTRRRFLAHYKIESHRDLRAADFSAAWSMLQRKREKAKKAPEPA